MALGTIYIIAACLALPAAVLAFIFIVPEKKREKMGKFGKLLHDICNFKFLIVEKIFQFFYVLSTAFCIIGGFFMLFWVERYSWYYGSSSEWLGYYGLLMMILGPISVRIAYEFIMLVLIAIKNIIQINNKLKNQNEDSQGGDMFAIPSFSKAAPVAAPVTVAAPVAAPAPAASVCPNCGSPKSPDAFCVYCGQK